MQTKTIENRELSESSKKAVALELDRILSSDLFSRSSVLSNFLNFIVSETLENQTDRLKEYTIAVSALGKPSDFNSQTDAIVRIHAGRLRRLLNEYYMGPGKSDPIKIEVIKGSYVPVFRTKATNDESDAAVTEQNRPAEFSRSKLTLAVLPFRNLCPENEYQFFADGFGEELTRIFSDFEDFAIIAHHSTRKYASAPEDVRIIGAALGAHYLIDGSVKRTAEEIRVNVSLIETLNGMQVWSQSYKYELNIDNLIAIQDQIIENICSILGGYYGFIVRDNCKVQQKTMSNIDSFDAAFWNYYLHMNFSQETYTQTLQAVKVALKSDPDYARGLAMLSELYLDAYSLGFTTVEDPVMEAYELSRKAIKIDPQCQHAYQQYGWANVYLKRKEEAIEAMERCLVLNTSSVSTMGAIGFGMACAGEYKRAKELLTQTFDLNPHSPWWFSLGFFLVHFQNGNYQKALEYANQIEVPDVFLDPLTKAAAKAQLGLTSEALHDVKTLYIKFPDILADLSTYLNTFLLDSSLIEEIIHGVKKAKVSIA